MNEMPAIGDEATVGMTSVAVGEVAGVSVALDVCAWLTDGNVAPAPHAESSVIDPRPTTKARRFLISVTADLRDDKTTAAAEEIVIRDADPEAHQGVDRIKAA